MSHETPADAAAVEIYSYPRSCPKSALYRVRVNGQPVFVHATGVADFACVSFSGRLEVEVEITGAVSTALIRPLSRGLQATISGNKIQFGLDRPENLQIEINGLKQSLHFYGNPPEQDRPAPDDPLVRYFRGGQVYEVGRLELKDNETLYLEGGAVLKGAIVAKHAQNIRICGRGVLDGSYYRDDHPQRCILLDHCDQAVIEDIIIIEPTSWMVLLGASRHVRITNLKEIGQVISSDGIDIVGSSDVVIDGCFLRNNDDCVVIKSFSMKGAWGEAANWMEDVNNVLVQNCVLMNDGAGNAMEIGFEICCDSVRNITFRNIDVLHVHGFGAVFSIHNCDRAAVSDVLWEDIRVEHCYDLFIDFRVSVSRYTQPTGLGSIENIRLKNIHWKRTNFNAGYTKSIIGGWDPTRPIRNVLIEDLYIDDRKITTPDELDLFTKSLTGLVIR